MNTTELHAVWRLGGGVVAVQTGIYVPDTMTIADVKELMAKYKESGRGVPDMVEFDMRGEEEAGE